MLSNNTDLAVNGSAVFFCPKKPIFTFILNDTATFKVAIITSGIACPITILLNIVVIIAVKNRRELQTNSNILLASLAAADLLVGAVSMPLTISLDALLLQKVTNSSICRIAFANQLVLYAASCSSLYHLTVIAWERYVAIQKWIDYKMIVTRSRVKCITVIAWLLAVLSTAPVRIMTSLGTGSYYKYVKVIELISFLPAVVCLVLIGYFYIAVYLGARKLRKVNDASEQQAPAIIIAKRERSIAKKAFMLTVVLLTFYVPSFVVLFAGEAIPFLRTSSYFRWSELMTQLNSLVNPLLYCFALKRFRKAVLDMLKIRKPERIQLAAGEERRRARRINVAEDMEDVLEFQELRREEDFARSGSCDSIQLRDAVYRNPLEPVMERSHESTSSPSEAVNQVIHVDVHEPKPRRRKPQVDFAIAEGSQPEVTDKPQSSHVKRTRAKTLDQNAFAEVITTLECFVEEPRQRSNTIPASHYATITPDEDSSTTLTGCWTREARGFR